MNEFKVGLLTLLTLGAVVFMSLKVTTNQSGFGDYVRYRTVIQDASGIFPKTPIRIAGITAGRIVRIELRDNAALITFEVLEHILVPEDSRIKIKTVGFLGDKYIEIVTGKSTKRLDEMAYLVADEGGGMEDLLGDASIIMKDVQVLMSTFRETFAPEGKESPLASVMRDMQEMTAQMNKLLTENDENFSNILENMERLTQSLADESDRALQDSSMAKLHAVLENTFAMTNDLKEMMSDVRAGKGTIGKFLVEEEIADEVRETLASVKKIVSRVDTLRTELSIFSGVNSDYGSETEAELRLFPSPERFYLLGVTTSEFGPEKEVLFSTSIDGVTSNRVEKTQRKDTYRFNVQLGRKIHNWSFRGGIIQTTGGFGIDYEIPHWGLKLSSEVYDYRKNEGINWRFFSEFQLWNVFYGRLALEDVLENDRSATVSAGLRFTDEDLKGLIGFFF
jgi:phospholipid/cholesterol/gamma-HCH transport system substrate-binding protein